MTRWIADAESSIYPYGKPMVYLRTFRYLSLIDGKIHKPEAVDPYAEYSDCWQGVHAHFRCKCCDTDSDTYTGTMGEEIAIDLDNGEVWSGYTHPFYGDFIPYTKHGILLSVTMTIFDKESRGHHNVVGNYVKEAA